jgi:hypothetical protein
LTLVPLRLRISPSGQIIPEGPADNVLTSLGPGLGWQSKPAGGGGSVAPLTGVAYVDAAADPGVADGSIGKPFADLQPALDAGFQTLLLCPGAYGNLSDATVLPVYILGLVEAGSGGPTEVSIGNIAINKAGGSLVLQNVGFGALTDTSGVAIIVTLIDVAMSGGFQGSGATVLRTGTQTQNLAPGFQPVSLQLVQACAKVSFAFTRMSGDVQATDGFFGLSSRLVGLTTTVATLEDCNVSGDILCTASGTSTVRASNIVGTCIWDKLNAYDSIFHSGQDGDGSGLLKFWNCQILDSINVPFTADGATELLSWFAGLVPAGDRVLALEQGQGGDAFIVTATTSITCTDKTRTCIPAVIPANIALTIDETGGTAPQQQIVDNFNTTGHTVNLLDSAGANIGPGGVALPAQAAGTGTRYVLQIDGTSGKFVLASFKDLRV